MTEKTLERAVARFVVNFKYEDIDQATLTALKGLIKDQFAIQIGASQLPWSKQTLRVSQPTPGQGHNCGRRFGSLGGGCRLHQCQLWSRLRIR